MSILFCIQVITFYHISDLRSPIKLQDNQNFIFKKIILEYIQSCIYMWIVVFKFECHHKSHHFHLASSAMSKFSFQIPVLRDHFQGMDEIMDPFFSQNFSLSCHKELYMVSRIILAIILVCELCFYLPKSYPHQPSTNL